MIFGALQVTKVLSTEEAKRAIEGSGKDFGKSIDCRVTEDLCPRTYVDQLTQDPYSIVALLYILYI